MLNPFGPTPPPFRPFQPCWNMLNRSRIDVDDDVDDVLQPIVHPSSQHRWTSFNKIERMLKQMSKLFTRAFQAGLHGTICRPVLSGR